MTVEQTTDTTNVVAELRRVFDTGRTRGLAWRRSQLESIERMCVECEPEIVAALGKDLGRDPAQSFLADIAPTKAEATYARKRIKRWARRVRVPMPLSLRPGRAWVDPQPLGVVLVIGPWNYPFYLTMAPIVAAVSAGNAAVIKPSEFAPATSALLAAIVPKYLDAEAVRVVEGDAITTGQLLSQGFDHALFTGGTAVGSKVMAAAADTLTPVTLELGGKSPAIVAADADLDVTARRLANAKLLNAGQTCIAPDYVLADAAIAAELASKIVMYMAEFRTSEKLQVVNARQFDRLVSMLSATTGSVLGGGSDRGGLAIEPTVIIDPSPSEPIMSEEIFGPILPILTIGSLDDAVAFVNSRPKPLALYVFTNSVSSGRDVIDRTTSGGAVINHAMVHCAVPQLPFGGVGASGMGAYHGKWGFDTLSHRRAVVFKPVKPDLRLGYPPYSERTLRIMKRLI
ncbi:aldehyde dehydrogenase [Mycolicibacterium setense]|uniref:aldehyde dehydrogenase family protein n=1 Tax=Mycolicibacterium setense TaxID=431269 RepID=UPI0007EA16CD|nr:aldehyde dehydrogenase family protein [Mycolicibacterium setense]OBB17648.1 aldehyde dehydrogenase [Mycolicibacterium setense]